MKESRKFSKQVMKRFKWNSLCIFTAMLCAGTTLAQNTNPDTLSVAEMTDGFMAYYRGEVRDSLPNYDMYYGHYYTVLYSSRFRTAGKIKLPPSTWKKGIKESQLFWTGFQPVATQEDTVAIRKRLEQKYGVSRDKNTWGYVPAKWFTGVWCRLNWPVPYGSTFVSPHLSGWPVKKGRFRGKKTKSGYLVNFVFRQNLEGNYIKQVTVNFWAFSEECWTRYFGIKELLFFQQDITRLCPPSDGIKGTASYTFLIHVDGQGGAHLYTLLPQTLTDADSTRIRPLARAVEALPPRMFGYFWTVDGRIFPGRYLKAEYKDGEWKFEDYLHVKRPKE